MNGKTILIADGDPHDRQQLANWLAADGYDVLLAEDGAQAVTAVHSRQLDLVLLSTSFPPDVAHGGGALCDGFLIIAWLRRTQEYAALRVILTTNEEAAKLRDKAKASGAVGLIQKPINQETLRSITQRILGGVAATA